MSSLAAQNTVARPEAKKALEVSFLKVFSYDNFVNSWLNMLLPIQSVFLYQLEQGYGVVTSAVIIYT